MRAFVYTSRTSAEHGFYLTVLQEQGETFDVEITYGYTIRAMVRPETLARIAYLLGE